MTRENTQKKHFVAIVFNKKVMMAFNMSGFFLNSMLHIRTSNVDTAYGYYLYTNFSKTVCQRVD